MVTKNSAGGFGLRHWWVQGHFCSALGKPDLCHRFPQVGCRPVLLLQLISPLNPRRFGWAFCRLAAKEISSILPQLKEHNVRLIGVGLETLGMEVCTKSFESPLLTWSSRRSLLRENSLPVNSMWMRRRPAFSSSDSRGWSVCEIN